MATDEELFQYGGKGVEKVEHEMVRTLARVGTDGVSVREPMNTWCSIVE